MSIRKGFVLVTDNMLIPHQTAYHQEKDPYFSLIIHFHTKQLTTRKRIGTVYWWYTYTTANSLPPGKDWYCSLVLIILISHPTAYHQENSSHQDRIGTCHWWYTTETSLPPGKRIGTCHWWYTYTTPTSLPAGKWTGTAHWWYTYSTPTSLPPGQDWYLSLMIYHAKRLTIRKMVATRTGLVLSADDILIPHQTAYHQENGSHQNSTGTVRWWYTYTPPNSLPSGKW